MEIIEIDLHIWTAFFNEKLFFKNKNAKAVQGRTNVAENIAKKDTSYYIAKIYSTWI